MRTTLRALAVLLGLGFRASPWLYIARSTLAFTGMVGPLLAAFGLRVLVNGAAGHHLSEAVWGGVLIGLALTAELSAHIGATLVVLPQRERMFLALDRRLMELTTAIPDLDHVERPQYRDRIQQMRDNQWRLHQALPLVWESALVAVQFGASLIIIARLQPWLLVLPLLGIPGGYLGHKAEKVLNDRWERASEPDRRARHLFELLVTADSAKEARVFGMVGLILETYRRTRAEVDRIVNGAMLRQSAYNAAGFSFIGAGYAVALLLSVAAAAQGKLTVGDVAMVMGLAGGAIGGLSGLVGQLSQVRRAMYFAGHYVWLEDHARTASRQPPHPAPMPDRVRGGIDIDHVTFRYPGSSVTAVKDVSLHLPPGRVVALVGENGAGKTSLVKLLTRMYAPTEGRILLDGTDFQEFDVDALRGRMSAGFQDYARFELVARETVGVGELARIEDRTAVGAAVDRGGASDVVDGLPDGLESQLGATWEHGIELSGGQWQKLAVARTVMRETPLLVIFDEPTANIDAQTEHALFERLSAAAQDDEVGGRVTILVSHRFSTVRMADLIVVLDQGRVIEQGTHGELMTHDGVYAELFSIQARAYL